MKAWLKYTLIVGLIVIAPIALNCMLQIPAFMSVIGTETDWLSFWSGYLGALISALVALLVLSRQLKQNHEQNQQNRDLQIALLKSEQERSWLNDLRSLFAQYIVSFDYAALEAAADEIIHGKRSKKPTTDFDAMLRRKQQVDASVRMYLSGVKDERINNYLLEIEHFNNEYYGLVEDLSWVTYMLFGEIEGGSIVEKTERYKNLHLSCINDEHRIWNIVEKHQYRIKFDIRKILEERFITIKDYPTKLIESVLNGLINYKTEQINALIQ